MNERFEKAARSAAMDLTLRDSAIPYFTRQIEIRFEPLATAHDLAITTLESCLRDRTDGGLAIATALAALKGE